MMNNIPYEHLISRAATLKPRLKELNELVAGINENFTDLGFEIEVWHPEKILTQQQGAIEALSYLGYAKADENWGLAFRTIQRDGETHAYIDQRVYPLAACGNAELIVNALSKIQELAMAIGNTMEEQITICVQRRINF